MTFWSDPIRFVADWLLGVLTGWGLTESASDAILMVLGAVALITFALVFDIFLVWVERKVVARFQDRLGPNRLGPFGLFQPFADVIKLIIKEDITPAGANKFLYNLAPVLSIGSVLLLWAVIPLAPRIYGLDMNVGLLYVVAAGALGTLAIIFAGWASNNKYALLGAFRLVATMVAYEVPMVVVLLIPAILADSLSIWQITASQNIWYVILSPLGALIFLIAAIAELGRSPFDLTEAESEIVAGYNIEYSGMKFGLFYAGELLHAFTFGGFVAILFFGGWRGPGAEQYPLLGAFYFMLKAMIGYWVIMWVKYTVPRIRIDHMLAFNWKFLTPLSLVVLMVTAVLDKVLAGVAPWLYALIMFLSNLLIAWVTIEILRALGRRAGEQAVTQQVARY